MVRRISLLVGTAMAATAVLAGAAGATKPERGPAEATPFTFPAGMVCAFPVYAEPTANRQTETIFSSGKVHFTGFFESRVVNLTNGKEATFVTSGPARLTPDGELLKLTTSGPLLFFFFPGDAGPGDQSTGRTYLFHGRTETLVDPATFEFLSFSYTGRAQDVCAMLS